MAVDRGYLLAKSEMKEFYAFFEGYIRKEMERTKGESASTILLLLADNPNISSSVQLEMGEKLLNLGGNPNYEEEEYGTIR